MDNPAVPLLTTRATAGRMTQHTFRMSFGMMLASPGREDRLCGAPGASAWRRLDMVVEASYAVIRRSNPIPYRAAGTLA